MRMTSSWLLTPLFTLAIACGDSGSDDTAGSTTAPMTSNPSTDSTGSSTGDATTDPTTSTTSPTTVDPTTGNPTTVDPSTTDPTTVDTSTTDGTTADGTTTGGVDYSCDNYCSIYEGACKDFNAYANTEDCLGQCSQWPAGEPNAIDGDSLACRLYHVTVASKMDAKVHCPHASPNGGGDTCVDPAAPTCMAYCEKYLANCKDKLNAYKDAADCAAQCGAWYPGSVADTVGDTVGCRLYHAGAAFGDAMTHCPHAGPGGADVCVVQ